MSQPPLIRQAGKPDKACFHVTLPMVVRMLDLMQGVTVPADGEARSSEDETTLALWRGLNACKTRLIK